MLPHISIDLWMPAFAGEGIEGYARLIFNIGLLAPRQYLPGNLVALHDFNLLCYWGILWQKTFSEITFSEFQKKFKQRLQAKLLAMQYRRNRYTAQQAIERTLNLQRALALALALENPVLL